MTEESSPWTFVSAVRYPFLLPIGVGYPPQGIAMAVPGQNPKRQYATSLAGRMRRREFITFLATAAASYPAYAVVQKPHRLPRIAIVSFRPVADEGRDRAFEETIDDRGWKDGKTVRLDYYWTSTGSLHQIAREAVGSAPNVIRGLS